MTLKRISLYLMIIFYILAGLNHFIQPAFYLPLIPRYLPQPQLINLLAGIAEVSLGVMLMFARTRRIGAYGIIAMLLAFIPSHVYFIQQGRCVEGGLCAPLWAGWVRLIVIHPILLIWAYWHRS